MPRPNQLPAFTYKKTSNAWYVFTEMEIWTGERRKEADDQNAWEAEESYWEAEESYNVEFERILNVIEQSKTILKLTDNWDGEGSVGYTQDTWERATDFLQELAECAYNLGYDSIGIPRILAADEGSVDIFWQDSSRDFLINFPADVITLPSAYGQNDKKETLEGALGKDFQKEQVIAWLNWKK